MPRLFPDRSSPLGNAVEAPVCPAPSGSLQLLAVMPVAALHVPRPGSLASGVAVPPPSCVAVVVVAKDADIGCV